MGIELTQWTVIRPLRPGVPRRSGDEPVWLKSPDGEMHVLAVGRLSTDTRATIGELASGSKVPKNVLAEILTSEGDTPVLEPWSTGDAAPRRPWTFYYLDRNEPLYVFLRPPELSSGPKAFSLAGLRPHLRSLLEGLVRGDRVPDEVLTALQASAVPSSAHRGPSGPGERQPDRQ